MGGTSASSVQSTTGGFLKFHETTFIKNWDLSAVTHPPNKAFMVLHTPQREINDEGLGGGGGGPLWG